MPGIPDIQAMSAYLAETAGSAKFGGFQDASGQRKRHSRNLQLVAKNSKSVRW